MNSDFPLFIFPFAHNLARSQEALMLDEVNTFLSHWKAHDSPMKARSWVEHSRFLLVEVDPILASPSGCSKDKLYHFVKNMNKKLGIQEAELNQFFIKSDSEILTFDKNGLKNEWESNSQFTDYQLFPIWISTTSEYNALWGKPVRQFQQMLRLNPEKTVFQK